MGRAAGGRGSSGGEGQKPPVVAAAAGVSAVVAGGAARGAVACGVGRRGNEHLGLRDGEGLPVVPEVAVGVVADAGTSGILRSHVLVLEELLST